MAGFLFRLETKDGAPAEPPSPCLPTTPGVRPKTDTRVAVSSGRELDDLPDDHQAEHQTGDRDGGDRHPRAAVAPECADAEHDRSDGERCSDPPAARRKVPRERRPGDGEKREAEGETGVVAGRPEVDCGVRDGIFHDVSFQPTSVSVLTEPLGPSFETTVPRAFAWAPGPHLDSTAWPTWLSFSEPELRTIVRASLCRIVTPGCNLP